MGKSTISMAIFNRFLYVYQRVAIFLEGWCSRSQSVKLPKGMLNIQWEIVGGRIESNYDICLFAQEIMYSIIINH